MPPPPPNPKIYHITHMSNLPSIIAGNGLVSDAVMIAQGGPAQSVGMSDIKTRRLTLPVICNPGDHVGEYVPFYFCSRSVMLYLLHMGNHPGLTYKGGQEPIVHLEADLGETIAWANTNGRRWAFSLSNAGARYTQFRNDPAQLDQVNWPAIANRDFRSSDVKEGKQAEFLLHHSFPWSLVRRVGVRSLAIGQQVTGEIAASWHRPGVEIQPSWYF